ncbi:hypothetical protein GE09DRAFT_762410 [Coniochaeta sp. 2T2.1]|nr:hypothetical protein GE09DRAFT_762410 [Coniochaeta sp. 2T2.1]
MLLCQRIGGRAAVSSTIRVLSSGSSIVQESDQSDDASFLRLGRHPPWFTTMTKPNRNTSKPAKHQGSAGRKAKRHRRTEGGRATTGSMSSPLNGDQAQPSSSTMHPSDTDGQTMDVDNSHEHLPPGWIEVDGYWYYPIPGNQYRLWHNEGHVAEYAEEAAEAAMDNSEGPYGQDADDNHPTQSWDGLSRRPKQGSADDDSDPGSAVSDADQGQEDWSSDVEEEFRNGPSPWSTESVVSHANGATLEGNAEVYVEGAYYPVSIDFQGDDDEAGKED